GGSRIRFRCSPRRTAPRRHTSGRPGPYIRPRAPAGRRRARVRRAVPERRKGTGYTGRIIPMAELVQYECADRIATLRLNRPEKLNAFTDEMVLALDDALHRFDLDPEAHVAII